MLQMVTKAQIEKFYLDVEKLGLKFPGAAIAKATGESKGNVSSYLNKKLDPSETFLKKFYKSFGDLLDKKTDAHVEIIKDRDKLIEEQQKDIIRLKATVNVLLITVADLVSKVDKKAISLADSELTEATNRENKALLDELKKK